MVGLGWFITFAMNKVTAFGGYSAMREYKKGNIHGVYADIKEFTENVLRRLVYSYLACDYSEPERVSILKPLILYGRNNQSCMAETQSILYGRETFAIQQFK